MTEERFKQSALWTQTLASSGDRDPHERERLRSSYLGLRDNITPLLAENARSMPDNTVHDISHVDAMWETAGLVCGDDMEINPAEAYVLGCGFAFHDAGQGLAAYPNGIVEVMGETRWRDLVAGKLFEANGLWPDAAEIDNPSDEVQAACVWIALRQLHAEQAMSLVEQRWQFGSGTDIYLIEDAELRQAYGRLIGKLAWSHSWRDIDRLRTAFRHTQGSPPWLPPDWTVDPLKLALILRLADATQLDSRRAPSFLFASRNPQGAPRDHWVFQEHVARPHLDGDRLVYTTSQPFRQADASAWWLAFDYLGRVNRHLRQVDDLLQDLDRPRLAARGVAHVDNPERFAEVFPVEGWQPIDAKVQISDIQQHITELGGEQLYGPAPEVALRELVQNAQDAVVARQTVDPDSPNGQVTVALEQRGEDWFLEVRDNGIGMDENIIRSGLLDFGRCGWRTETVRSAFVGLASNGFKPTGRFGMGFYSAFMLGDRVTVTTRRYDLRPVDARRLTFTAGLSARPLLCPSRPDEAHIRQGTAVRIKLKADATAGLVARSTSTEITELVRRLVPNRRVPITVKEWFDPEPRVLAPSDLETAAPEEVFEQLYPAPNGSVSDREQWAELRDEFCAQATDIRDENGRRLGLAALGNDLVARDPALKGVVVLDGFRADEHEDFTGYMTGKPGRASRDNVELACTPEQLTGWITSQVQRLRERNRFGPPQQLELSDILYRATGSLPDDHHIAMTSAGLVTVAEIRSWVAERDEVILSYGWPCEWKTRPPALQHGSTGTPVTLPEGWLVPYLNTALPYLDAALPRNRDTIYEHHRHDPEDTWEKRWWLASDLPEGLMFKLLCEAWSCQLEDLLAPVAKRGWNDNANLGIPEAEVAPVLRFHHP